MTDSPRYYASRDGNVAGPYTIAELRAQLNAQALGLDDLVCLEGSQEWLAIGAVRAIVPRDSKAAPLPKAQPAKAGRAGTPLEPRAAYAPGAPPTLPGIYLPFAAGVDDLLLRLEGLEHPPAPPADPAPRLRRVRRRLSLFLLGASAGACAVDARLGYPFGVFSMLTPFAWLGLILEWVSTRLPGARPSSYKRRLGCSAVVLLPVFFLVLEPFAAPNSNAYSAAIWAIGAAAALWLASVLSASAGAPQAPALETVVHSLQLAREVLESLRDDVAPGRRISGWLDLTGPDQPGKVVRSGQARNGAKVDLLRDEWWRLRVPLRDGNELRISAVERVKARRDHWKRNARGKSKLKRGRSESLSTLEVRLAVNETVYRLEPLDEEVTIGGLRVPRPTSEPGALSVVVPAEPLEPGQVLGVLASLYRQLKPANGAQEGR